MLNYQRQTYGGLDCVVAQAASPQAPSLTAVFLHGFGAGGDDLVPLAEELVHREPSLAARVRFVFPAALLEPPELADFGGRAWWPIDMLALQRAVMLQEIRDLRRESPAELPAAREALLALLAELQAETGARTDQLLLGGFSQGAMLATDVALRLPEPPAGLVVWSGTLLSEEAWRELAPRRAGLRVVQSHGRQDPILPFAGALALRDLFEESGLAVDFLPFDGPHTISQAAVDATARLLADLAASR